MPLPLVEGVEDAGRRSVLDRLLVQLIDLVAHENENFTRISTARDEAAQRSVIASLADAAFEKIHVPDGVFLTKALRSDLIERLCHELLGFGPIQPLILDPGVTEIMINGPDRVFVEREGLLTQVPVHFRSREHLSNIIERIVWRLGRRIDESSPMVDARLPDGSRVNAAISPVALGGPFLTIRKFPAALATLDALIKRQTLSVAMADFLRLAVLARVNIVISGGTSSGKTTLLNVLASLTPPQERIITIEDSAELRFTPSHVNVCSFEARAHNVEGKGAITIRDLIRNALRMRPDRLIVGEVRGAEAIDMLQAMNTGHEGSFTTVHANTAHDLFSRLETMVCMAATELPVLAIRDIIASAVHLVVQVSRLQDGTRKIVQIMEVVGVGVDGRVACKPIWTHDVSGYASDGSVEKAFKFHGVPELTQARFEEHGVPMHSVLHDEDGDVVHAGEQGAVPLLLTRLHRNL